MMIFPKDNSIPYEVLKNFSGNKMIYIGSYDYCATNEFYDLVFKEWKKVKVIEVPQWINFNDNIYLYVRK